ncbi:hypothetical protein WG902_14520 [Ramlibacter sp. PS3R-8]|uniref:hypothetical protein n=1 Tax=Ramlibacter sp. PS3R-8 TaxID=3133437 RepID=UPI00309C71AB
MAFSLPPKKNPARKDELDRPWVAGDSIPAGDAVHKDSDSGWALWNEASQVHERKFMPTAPMTAPGKLSTENPAWAATQPAGMQQRPGPIPKSQPLFTLESAMLVARRNNRVCPRPERWNELSKLLPPRKTLRGSQQPPVPITGPAWGATPALTKRLCFREQIEWAESQGVLENVVAFMQTMSEAEWLHMGED